MCSLEDMERWEAIRARRNVRTYGDRAIAPEHLDRVLEAGWRSPSASNRQKLDFIVVTAPDQLEKLSTVWVGAGHLAAAKAAMSGHSAVGDQEECRRIVGVPPEHTCAYMIAFGYPANRPLRPIGKPDRRPYDEVVHRGRW